MQETVIMLAYSAMKKAANVMLEYSVWNPATSSFSASGKSNGGLFVSATMQMPNMIWLYRRPILDYWAEHDETLGAVVKHVLIHEIGHHFGLSDAAMAAIEAGAEA